MKPRVAGFGLIVAGSAVALAMLAGIGLVTAQTEPPRISFVVATGPGGGTYFPVGQALADIVSHPPGVARCDTPGVCGPSGLIASARTSDGAFANVLDVNAHRVDAGLVQSDVVAEAIAGKGAFRKFGAQTHIRIIADLFPEEVHVVAGRHAHIATVQDLKGKRVSIGAADSGTIETARALLAAYRIPERRIRESNDPPDVAAQRLQKGEIDAFVFVGGAPVVLVESLVARGQAVLVPIDGAGRKRLLAQMPSFSAAVIPVTAYPGSPAVQTVSERAIWIVNDSEPADLVYGVTRALFNSANRQALDDSHPSARWIQLQTAIATLPAPLHPGAARFYREEKIR
ncbi:MAG: TAXI family TRAP transporter solute-binding subunit [Rhizomicrobium sp.]|jgi:TRAP transporter TAXI family solute receptor